jgi:hypothetical protein
MRSNQTKENHICKKNHVNYSNKKDKHFKPVGLKILPLLIKQIFRKAQQN